MIDQKPKTLITNISTHDLFNGFPYLQHYEEFRKLYLSNRILETRVQELTAEKQSLLNKIDKAEKGQYIPDNTESQNQDKKKRVRRVASEIKRHYQCQHPNCNKSYGSQGSLNQHIKFKHPAMYEDMFKDKIEDKVEIKDQDGGKGNVTKNSPSNQTQKPKEQDIIRNNQQGDLKTSLLDQ